MSLQNPGQAGARPLLFAGFNQVAPGAGGRPPAEPLHVALAGGPAGCGVFSLAAAGELEALPRGPAVQDVCLVESLFSGLRGVVALVSLRAPRKLGVYRLQDGAELCAFHYSSSVLAARASGQRLVVCLAESLFIYRLRDLQLLHVIKETPPNPDGVCALSLSSALAYLGASSLGKVQVFDAARLQASRSLLAHASPVAALAFNPGGSLLATASRKGTVIRVFAVPEGHRLHEFRRGLTRYARIYSLAFSADGAFLSASSNTETVHVFKLRSEEEKRQEEATWLGYLGKALLASSPFLPAQVSEVFSQGRAFATVHLSSCGDKNICSLATIQKVPVLLVASSDGYLYVYRLDPREGGECTLMKQHWLSGRCGGDE